MLELINPRNVEAVENIELYLNGLVKASSKRTNSESYRDLIESVKTFMRQIHEGKSCRTNPEYAANVIKCIDAYYKATENKPQRGKTAQKMHEAVRTLDLYMDEVKKQFPNIENYIKTEKEKPSRWKVTDEQLNDVKYHFGRIYIFDKTMEHRNRVANKDVNREFMDNGINYTELGLERNEFKKIQNFFKVPISIADMEDEISWYETQPEEVKENNKEHIAEVRTNCERTKNDFTAAKKAFLKEYFKNVSGEGNFISDDNLYAIPDDQYYRLFLAENGLTDETLSNFNEKIGNQLNATIEKHFEGAGKDNYFGMIDAEYNREKGQLEGRIDGIDDFQNEGAQEVKDSIASILEELKYAKTMTNSKEYKQLISSVEQLSKHNVTKMVNQELAEQVINDIKAYYEHKGRDGIKANSNRKLMAVERLYNYLDKQYMEYREYGVPDPKMRVKEPTERERKILDVSEKSPAFTRDHFLLDSAYKRIDMLSDEQNLTQQQRDKVKTSIRTQKDKLYTFAQERANRKKEVEQVKEVVENLKYNSFGFSLSAGKGVAKNVDNKFNAEKEAEFNKHKQELLKRCNKIISAYDNLMVADLSKQQVAAVIIQGVKLSRNSLESLKETIPYESKKFQTEFEKIEKVFDDIAPKPKTNKIAEADKSVIIEMDEKGVVDLDDEYAIMKNDTSKNDVSKNDASKNDVGLEINF